MSGLTHDDRARLRSIADQIDHHFDRDDAARDARFLRNLAGEPAQPEQEGRLREALERIEAIAKDGPSPKSYFQKRQQILRIARYALADPAPSDKGERAVCTCGGDYQAGVLHARPHIGCPLHGDADYRDARDRRREREADKGERQEGRGSDSRSWPEQTYKLNRSEDDRARSSSLVEQDELSEGRHEPVGPDGSSATGVQDGHTSSSQPLAEIACTCDYMVGVGRTTDFGCPIHGAYSPNPADQTGGDQQTASPPVEPSEEGRDG